MKKSNIFVKIMLGFSIIILIFISSTFYINLELKNINKKLTLLNEGYILFIKNLSKIQLSLNNDKKILDKITKEEKPNTNLKVFLLNRYKNHPIDKIFIKSIVEINDLLDKNLFYEGRRFYNFAKIELNILKDYYQNNVKKCSDYINDENIKQNCKNSMNRLVIRVEYLNRVADKKLSELSIKIEETLDKIIIYNYIFMALSTLIIIIISIFSIMLISPIRKLINAVSLIQKGDYSHRVNMKTSGEIGTLVNSFNEMIINLKTREEQIKKQEESLRQHHQNEIKIKNKLLEVERLAAIGKISAQIAHEIRNPLNSINLNTEIIGDEIFSDDFTPEEIKPLFKHIKIEIERLKNITDKYLRLAKEPDLHLETADIIKLIKDIYELMSVEFKQKNINLEKYFELESLIFSFDKNIIKSVVINILKNSLEASGKNGIVNISVEKSLKDGQEQVKITIKDNGIGISKEDKENIFNPFFTTKKYGTGIGLFAVKEGVVSHGGEIDVKSEFGKGTELSIYLPLQ